MPLTLVATPMGNLKDITYRAVEILNESDVILCEDTRISGVLLKEYNICNKKLISYHNFTTNQQMNGIQNILLDGAKKIAYITDAGTPGISDPGFELVNFCLNNNISVTMAPGPCAAIMGCVLSGLSTHKIIIEGFPPRKDKDIINMLNPIKNLPHTLVFYKSPHRIENFIQIAYATLGERRFSIGREMTKKFESFYYDKLSANWSMDTALNCHKGEMTLMIEGYTQQEPILDTQQDTDDFLVTQLHAEDIKILNHLSVTQQVQILSTRPEFSHIKKSHIYTHCVNLRKK